MLFLLALQQLDQFRCFALQDRRLHRQGRRELRPLRLPRRSAPRAIRPYSKRAAPLKATLEEAAGQHYGAVGHVSPYADLPPLCCL
jgi:hypothetical protein